MAKIQNAANSTEESIGIAMSRTELFFEKNGKALTLGLIVLVLLGGLWVGYRNLVSKPRHEKAAELLAQHPGHPRKVFGLVVRVGDALDIGINLLG